MRPTRTKLYDLMLFGGVVAEAALRASRSLVGGVVCATPPGEGPKRTKLSDLMLLRGGVAEAALRASRSLVGGVVCATPPWGKPKTHQTL